MFPAFQRWFRIENRTIIKETTSILAICDGFGFLQTIGGALIRGGALNWQITVFVSLLIFISPIISIQTKHHKLQ